MKRIFGYVYNDTVGSIELDTEELMTISSSVSTSAGR